MVLTNAPIYLKKKFHGFTLVELLVVIAVISILGFIGFLSIGGYSARARDTTRIADVSNIIKALELSDIAVGSYPEPDNSFTVTYSGGSVWHQGSVGPTVMSRIQGTINGGGLKIKPIDPLRSTEYTYSTLAYSKGFQIKIDYEGDLNVLASAVPEMVPTAFAAPGAPTIAYIKGTFAGLAAKTNTG